MSKPSQVRLELENSGKLVPKFDPRGGYYLANEMDQYLLRLQRAYEEYGTHLTNCTAAGTRRGRLSIGDCPCGWTKVIRGEV